MHVWLCVHEHFPYCYSSWFAILSWITLLVRRVDLLQSGMLRTALCQLWEQSPLEYTCVKIHSPRLLSSLLDLFPPTKVKLWQLNNKKINDMKHNPTHIHVHVHTYTHTCTKLTLAPATPGTPGTPWLIENNAYNL